jgi:hypothetical protein
MLHDAPWTFAPRSRSEVTARICDSGTMSSFVMSSGAEASLKVEYQIG